MWLALLFLIAFAFRPPDATAVIVYRIGTPFETAEKDSLKELGIDFREISWAASHLESELQLDSLNAGILQPIFFGADVNIAATTLDRGGVVRVFLFASENTTIGNVLIDEDPNTAYTWDEIDADQFANSSFGQQFSRPVETVTIDLGGRFYIKEVRFRPLASHPEHYLDEFLIGVGDEYKIRGRGSGLGSVFYDPIFERVENDEPDIRAFLDPPVVTRLIQLQVPRVTPKELGIAEFEVFGGGFSNHAAYESDVIEMDDLASLGEITWSGRQDPLAQVDIQTRSGSDPQPEIYWESRPEQQDSVRFLQGGGDLTLTQYKREYDRLSEFLKPLDQKDWVSRDTENWSFWSTSYPFQNPGIDIASPSPHKYFQLRANFSSTVEDGGRIDYIEFKASVPPAALEVLGEIFPVETEVGNPTHFTYYIKPTIRPGDLSFDAIEISAPFGVSSVDSLRMDEVDQGEVRATIHEDGLGFDVKLPRKLDADDSGLLLEIVFTAPVLREVGTVFAGRVYDSLSPHEVRQRVIPGDAAEEIESEQLSVTTSLRQSMVFNPQLSPNPFTPNGDGINDVAIVSYKLLRVTSPVPVAVEIFDVSGRLIKQVYSGYDPPGGYAHIWNGTDRSNSLVPPGVYLCRIVADVQLEKDTSYTIVSVVY